MCDACPSRLLFSSLKTTLFLPKKKKKKKGWCSVLVLLYSYDYRLYNIIFWNYCDHWVIILLMMYFACVQVCDFSSYSQQPYGNKKKQKKNQTSTHDVDYIDKVISSIAFVTLLRMPNNCFRLCYGAIIETTCDKVFCCTFFCIIPTGFFFQLACRTSYWYTCMCLSMFVLFALYTFLGYACTYLLFTFWLWGNWFFCFWTKLYFRTDYDLTRSEHQEENWKS